MFQRQSDKKFSQIKWKAYKTVTVTEAVKAVG